MIRPKCTQRIFCIKLALEHLIFHQLFVFFCMDTIAIFLSFFCYSVSFSDVHEAQFSYKQSYSWPKYRFASFFSYLLSLFVSIFLRIFHDIVWTITCNYMYMQTGASKPTIDRLSRFARVLVLHFHLVGIFQLNILHSHTQCISILSFTCSCRLYRSIAAELRYAWFSIRSAIVQSKIDQTRQRYCLFVEILLNYRIANYWEINTCYEIWGKNMNYLKYLH